MTKWLASVQSVDETVLMSAELPDILDMKNPAEGALGAMQTEEISKIVELIKGRCLTSATVGDLPMVADQVSAAIDAVAATGVDYVKMGVFPDKELADFFNKLALTIKKQATPVIAVLFADNYPSNDILPLLKRAGFQGVMIDTAFKNGKSLLDNWTHAQISSFVEQAKQHDLLCGLAGALRQQDVDTLAMFKADYLGFRSALCEQQKRTATLSINLVQQLKIKLNGQRLVA